MLQDSIARGAAPRRGRHGRFLSSGCAGVALLLITLPAAAQQYGAVGTSVTVDYSVLDSMGTDSNLPALLGGAAPAPGGNAYPSPYPQPGQLLPPPPSAPRSTLTVQTPTAVAPGGSAGVVTLIPPSEFKTKRPAAEPQKLPTPGVPPAPPAAPGKTSQQETQQAAAQPEPTPPPPPAKIEPPAPAAEQPAASSAAAEQAAPPSPPPAPAAPPQAAAAEAAPPPAPPAPEPAPESAPGMGAAQVATPSESAEPDPAPAAEPVAAASEPEPSGPASDSDPAEGLAAADPVSAPAGEEPGDTQTAALPSPAEGQVRVVFEEGSSELTSAGRAALDEMAETLRSDPSLRVQLLAYAAAIDDNTSRARRTSLSRALAVRSYLIEKGVPSTRMDVRALGNNVEEEPADRVDIIPQAQ